MKINLTNWLWYQSLPIKKCFSFKKDGEAALVLLFKLSSVLLKFSNWLLKDKYFICSGFTFLKFLFLQGTVRIMIFYVDKKNFLYNWLYNEDFFPPLWCILLIRSADLSFGMVLLQDHLLLFFLSLEINTIGLIRIKYLYILIITKPFSVCYYYWTLLSTAFRSVLNWILSLTHYLQ